MCNHANNNHHKVSFPVTYLTDKLQVKGFSILIGKLKTLAYKVVIHLRVAYIPLKSIFTDTA